MAYYVRKISRAKWQSNPLSIDPEEAKAEILQVSSDAITNCIKTKGGRLSLWKLDNKTDTIDDIVPLISGFEKLDKCDIVYIEDSVLIDEGFNMEQSPTDANTPIESLKENHYNVIVQDYDGLGKFAKVILMSLGNHKRYSSNDVKRKLKSMIENREIDKELLAKSLLDKII